MKHRSAFRIIATLSLLGHLTACGSVTPAGIVAARSLDPLGTPPDDIALAIGVPTSLRLADGDARLRMAFSARSEGVAIQSGATAELEIRPGSGSGPRSEDDGEHVFVARIAPDDAPGIAAIQSEIRALRARGVEGEGSLTINLVGGCYDDTPPAEVTVSTWIRTSPDADFVRLTRQADIAKALGPREAALLVARLRPCEE